jgi:phosphoribosylcarboxyaminoimidazole (NCAIR) mutase
MDMKDVDIGASGLEIVKPPKLSFKVVVELDKKMEKGVDKDPLLQQEFHAGASEVFDQTRDTIQKKCKVFDKAFGQMIAKGADKKLMEKQLKGLNDAIKNDIKVGEKAAELAAQKAWTNLQKKKKEWSKFKIKVGVSIAGTLAGLAVSIAAMATSPFSGGAGAAFGIIGLIKSGVSLAQDIGKLAINIDQSKTILVKNLAVVEKAAANPALNAANEVSAAVFQEFLGISQPSVKTVEDAAETLKAKYAQMVVKMHDLSKTLNKILKEQDKLKKEFLSEVGKKLKQHPVKDKKTQLVMVSKALDAALADNYAQVQKAIDKIQTMYADARGWATNIKDLMKRVNALTIKDPKALKVFREGLKFAALALAPLDGNSIATGAKDLALGVGGAAGGYVYDKITSKALDGTVFDAA